jgi:2-dehydropantoate 2-reductase
VGPGAIGTTVAAALHEAGRTPMLCGRTARQHLELHHGEDVIVVPGPVQTDPAQPVETVDLVFLAVKSTQVNAAAAWLMALCHSDTVVCVLQNGVEQEATVAPYVPGCAVWLRGEARLTLPDTPAAHLVLEALRGTRCSVALAADFTSVAWRKLLQNAVAGRRAGIFHRADISQLAIEYLWECLEVARADGAVLGDQVPQEILDSLQAFPADMGTSILADREAKRPLEWDIRNGVVLRRGRAHGIPTPISDVVVPLLAAASDGPG